MTIKLMEEKDNKKKKPRSTDQDKENNIPQTPALPKRKQATVTPNGTKGKSVTNKGKTKGGKGKATLNGGRKETSVPDLPCLAASKIKLDAEHSNCRVGKLLPL